MHYIQTANLHAISMLSMQCLPSFWNLIHIVAFLYTVWEEEKIVLHIFSSVSSLLDICVEHPGPYNPFNQSKFKSYIFLKIVFVFLSVPV